MALKNQPARPSRQPGTPATGNAAPLAKMPANNNGTFPVKLGAGQNSKFGAGVHGGAAQHGVSQKKAAGRANMPAHNNGQQAYNLGTTKHGVGQVPGYLRGK